MAAKFDNLDDVNSKFGNTVCLHEKLPVLVQGAQVHPVKPKGFELLVKGLSGKTKMVDLEDPHFSYRDFNIGYANQGKYAVWYYRKAAKQFRQGLKREQLAIRVSEHHLPFENNFGWNPYHIDMLCNKYPTRDHIEELLRTERARIVAFHKHFALAYDQLHDDYILEYQGQKIGHNIRGSLKDFRLVPDFEHLKESLMEALN